MTTINSSITATPQKQKKERSSFSKALLTGGTAGVIADVYSNSTKTIPNKYLKQIDSLEKEVFLLAADNAAKFREAIKLCKNNLSQVIQEKYGFIDNILNNKIRDDAELALKPLNELKLVAKEGLADTELKKFKQVNKVFTKLTDIAKNSFDQSADISKDWLIKLVKNGLKQQKWTIIGTGLAFIGILGYNKMKNR